MSNLHYRVGVVDKSLETFGNRGFKTFLFRRVLINIDDKILNVSNYKQLALNLLHLH